MSTMAPDASIQSFYLPSSSPVKPVPLPPSSGLKDLPSTDSGDGRSPYQVHRTFARSWVPQKDYIKADISTLTPGSQSTKLTARIVNFHEHSPRAKAPYGAQGCIRFILKDDTGAITVHLWFANEDYRLRLGYLVSIWTSHVSTGANLGHSVNTAPLFVSLFPERDRSCHLVVHEDDSHERCRMPLGLRRKLPFEKPFTLQSYIDGAHKISDARVLVVVKSLGPRKKITTKPGESKETRKVVVFDNTTEAVLCMWGPFLLSSTDQWIPSETILLITNARCDISSRPYVALTANSYVDVDPLFSDADWLRNYVRRLGTHQPINIPFPNGVFNLEQYFQSDTRALFRVSELDEYVRSAPHAPFVCYLNLILFDLYISYLYRRTQLFSSSCCNLPIHNNTPITICRQCQTPVLLRLNPRIVRTVLDETGSIEPGKLVWSSKAWTELFGRNEQQLAEMGMEGMRYLERRMSGLRVSLVVGWAGSRSEEVGGRLCVLGVRE